LLRLNNNLKKILDNLKKMQKNIKIIKTHLKTMQEQHRLFNLHPSMTKVSRHLLMINQVQVDVHPLEKRLRNKVKKIGRILEVEFNWDNGMPGKRSWQKKGLSNKVS
jgi:hypothetical protein